jgi:hypothetical protein
MVELYGSAIGEEAANAGFITHHLTRALASTLSVFSLKNQVVLVLVY